MGTVCLSAIKFRVVAGMFYGVRARVHGTLLLTYVHLKLWRWFVFHARSSPLTVGCAGGCTREVIEDTNFMHEAAADFAQHLSPATSIPLWIPTQPCLLFLEVAHASPLPRILRNLPGVVSGPHFDSGMPKTLGAHPDIVALKLTCGGIAKVA